MNFEVGQEVWIIQDKYTQRTIKCDCCNGKGKLFATTQSETNPTIECTCPVCSGGKKVKQKKQYYSTKVTIRSCFEFYNSFKTYTCEAYIVCGFYKIYTDNEVECKNFLSRLSFAFDSDHDCVYADESVVTSIENLFSTEEEAIEKCRELTKAEKENGI